MESSRVSTLTQQRESLASTELDLSRHLFLVVLGDCVVVLAAYVVAFQLRSLVPIPFTNELLPSERFLQVRHYWWLILALQPALLFLLDTYHEIRLKSLREFIQSIGAASGIQVLILISVYFFSGNLTFPRTIFPIYWMLNWAGLVYWRLVVKRTASQRKRRALIVGTGPLAEQLIAELERTPEIGLEVAGIVSDRVGKGEFVDRYEVLGRNEDVPDLIRLHEIEQIILTPEETTWRDRLVHSISRLGASSVSVSIVPSIYEILIGRIKHFNIRDIPLIEVVEKPNDPVTAFLRRSRDLVFSIMFILILIPLWAVVAVAIKLSDGGSVLYGQDRVGKGGKLFRLYKFRTMLQGSEDETGPVLAKADDPRLTRLGRFLRGYRIDETVQLVNVFKGDMSLVGPRPDRPEFVSRFATEIHGYNERHKVKPGITGLAQIRGYYHTDPAIKLKYDLAYIYNYSFFLDLIILLETFRIVVRKRGI